MAATMPAGADEALVTADRAPSDECGDEAAGAGICARQCAMPAGSTLPLESVRLVASAFVARRFVPDGIVERRDPPEPAPPRPHA